MNFQSLITDLTADSENSIMLFMPEICLSLFISLFLLVRLISRRIDLFWVALVGAVAGLISSRPWELGSEELIGSELFTGLLVHDGLTVAMRTILMGFLVMFLIFTKISGIPDREDGADIYSLIFGATLGMCLMVSANHLLVVFLAIEMTSVPSYVLAALMKGRRRGSEAGLKYAIYGAGAAGIMLYGISLLSGLTSSAHLPTIALQLAEILPNMSASEQAVLCLSAIMIAAGVAFKLSVVPFHFWAPDVFHGACAEVNAFLSIASKAAALALLLRLAVGLGSVPLETVADSAEADGATANVQLLDMQQTTPVAILKDAADDEVIDTAVAAVESPDQLDDRTTRKAAKDAQLAPVRNFISLLVAFFAIITTTFGNLAAYGQTNIKRMLAYSTIAHAGYMIMAICPLMALLGVDSSGAENAASALLQYIVVYVFMNLGAFAIIAFLRNYIGSEEISDYSGMIKTRPALVICLALIFFSLVGLPPLAGFLGKFAIFASITEAYTATTQNYLLVILVVAGINTAISLFYYIAVIKTMIMGEPSIAKPVGNLEVGKIETAYVIAITAPTVLLIVCWESVAHVAQQAVVWFIA
ncbi:MAG: NADH-quinone oxidoreductase subunit N [Planctomycetaceae bacterium]|jgi:NADH-quinone oxidoreductase subunit N|nr:NADH-quinone oxidoreductase subunit N [Planctomycetaceae bacterium]